MNVKQIAVTIMVSGSLLFAVNDGYDYSVNVKPSATPPVENPPQLIVIGSDDNTSAHGMKWLTDFLETKKHSDGSKLRISYYSNVQYWEDDSALVAEHVRAQSLGYEIGNHTRDHVYIVNGETGPSQKRMSLDSLKFQMEAVHTAFEKAGLNLKLVKGFRTPYLAYSDTAFTAMKDMGFTYDCSVGEGNEYDMSVGGYYWPYTLNTRNNPQNEKTETVTLEEKDYSYAPGNALKFSYWNQTYSAPIREHAGLWELPCYAYQAPDSLITKLDSVGWGTEGKVDPLDYNMWAANKESGFQLNKEQSLAVLTNNFDEVYRGNRAPITIGMHSQYYTNEQSEYKTIFPAIPDSADRQAVLEEFVEYALAQGDDVYFVSGSQAIAYCMRPVSAGEFKPDDYLVGEDGVIKIDIPDEVEGSPVSVLADVTWATKGHSDDMGSAAAVEASAEKALVKLTQVPSIVASNPDESKWSYCGAAAQLEGSLEGVTHIELFYSSDRDFSLGLSTADYGYTAAVAKGENTSAKVSVGDFKLSWANGDDKALKLADIGSVAFQSSNESSEVQETNIEITKIVLYGYSGASSISTVTSHKSAISLLDISTSDITLDVNSAGVYTVSLFSLSGKKLGEVSSNLLSGQNRVDFSSLNLSSQFVVVNISHEGISSSYKMVIK